jgi:anthranilate phosphoribosyltransferase
MDNKYGKRICASLLGLQFVKHGEQFSGGGVASADAFEALDDEDLDDLV